MLEERQALQTELRDRLDEVSVPLYTPEPTCGAHVDSFSLVLRACGVIYLLRGCLYLFSSDHVCTRIHSSPLYPPYLYCRPAYVHHQAGLVSHTKMTPVRGSQYTRRDRHTEHTASVACLLAVAFP